MSLIKKILIAIAVIIIIALISAAAAYKLIDDKTIEKNALDALQNTLKRDVIVDGQFTLTRSLHPTLQTSGVRVASADWDKDSNLLTAEKLEFGVALLDLLRGVISIENIVFDNAVINLKRNQQGQSNLEFTQEAPKEKSTGGKGTALLDVIDVKIKNLQINYSDQQTEKSFVYSLESFELHPKNKDTIQIKASSRFDDQPLELSSEMCRIRHLLQGNDCNLTADINAVPFNSAISGMLNIANEGNLNLKINTNATNIREFLLAKQLPLPDTEKVTLSTQLVGSFGQLNASNIDVEVKLKDTAINVQGDIASVNAISGVNLSVNASGTEPAWLNNYQTFFPSEIVDNFELASSVESDGKSWRAHSIDSNIEIDNSKILTTGEVTIAGDSTRIAVAIDISGKNPAWLNEVQQAIAAENIDEFSVKTSIINPDGIITIGDLESKITIKDAITTALGSIVLDKESQPTIDLALTSEGKNIQSFEGVIKQSLPTSKNFSLKTNMKYAGNTLSLKDVNLVLDNTQLAGNSDIEFSSPPNVRANITAESLNVEHLLATTQSDEKENSEKEERSKLFSDDKIDLDWLNSANTDISLTINNLIYKEATLKDVKAKAVAKNNTAMLDIESLNYLDANLRANALIDANKDIFSHSLFTENFNLGQLLSDIEASETLQGKIDASIDVNSFGTSSQQLAKNANGKITAVMTEGSLADAPIDLLAKNLLVELMPGKPKKKHTKVECLFVQFSGTEGVFTSEATLLNTENIVMQTNGSIDLSMESLNLLLIPKPKDIEFFTLGANIRVVGDLQNPSFSLDKGSVFKKLLKSAATVALGPAVLAIPFDSMGGNKSKKCFSEVASATTKAVEAEQEAERIAAEKLAEEEAAAAEKAKEELLKEATVEPLDP
ncbi:MAG: AsmA family protein [Gammaproteobacteria bacterium]|nr:AsmA family protein [Gammaproteobacteria bacterium]